MRSRAASLMAYSVLSRLVGMEGSLRWLCRPPAVDTCLSGLLLMPVQRSLGGSPSHKLHLCWLMLVGSGQPYAGMAIALATAGWHCCKAGPAQWRCWCR